MRSFVASILLAALATIAGTSAAANRTAADPIVRMTTNMGAIEIRLDAHRAPKTTANFLHYVDKGFYNGTIFHRVIRGFMIQGGGFKPGLKPKRAGAPIANEADNGLKNLTGTIAMARTMAPNSARAQFFINTADNGFLNHRDKSIRGWGYAVFGKVIKGMNVVRKIEAVPTTTMHHHRNVPVRNVVIIKIARIRK